MAKISKKSLIREIIKRGLFKVENSSDKRKWIPLKNGFRTPIFLDTSKFISYPDLLEKINKYIIQTIKENKINFDQIMGLPYGGLPFAYGIINILKLRSLAIRKEGKKNYSTAGDLLGIFEKGERVLLIEDAIATADTAVGFVKRLRQEELIVKDLITIVDAGMGGKENLQNAGVRTYAIFTWAELIESYRSSKPKISKETEKFLKNLPH